MNDLNNSFVQAAQTNSTFQCLDDYSATVSQMQTTTAPYPSNVESLATSGAGELERLRYQIKQIHGGTYWYSNPNPLTPPGDMNLGVSSSRSAVLYFFHGSSGFYTGIQGGNATQNLVYALPTAAPTSNGQALISTTAGVMSWSTLGTALKYNGSTTAETCTSTGSEADLVTVTPSTSMANTVPFLITFNYRKTAGAANVASFGLTLNSTLVVTGATVTTTTNQAEDGSGWIYVGPRNNNVNRPIIGLALAQPSATAVYPLVSTTNLPTAAITTMVLRGNSNSVSISMCIGNAYLYTLATS